MCRGPGITQLEAMTVCVAPCRESTAPSRDRKGAGFSRVAALHVIAIPGKGEDFWGAIRTTSQLGDHALPEAERQVIEEVGRLSVGHCILSIGEVVERLGSSRGPSL